MGKDIVGKLAAWFVLDRRLFLTQITMMSNNNKKRTSTGRRCLPPPKGPQQLYSA